jgi:hypothetical protein
MDHAQAGAYGQFSPRPSPYIQSPYNPQSIPATDKMNDNQNAYLGQQDHPTPINVSQLGQMAPINAYAQHGQSPGGQIYAPLVPMKFNMADSQLSSPGGQQPYSGNNTHTHMALHNQAPQGYPFGPSSQLQQQQNTAYPQNLVPNSAGNVASQFNYGQ